jgi:hypothetical protein
MATRTKRKDPAAAALAEYAAAPAGAHALAPRRAQPGYSITSNLIGPEVSLSADGDGIVRISTSEQARLADALGLPIIKAQED